LAGENAHQFSSTQIINFKLISSLFSGPQLSNVSTMKCTITLCLCLVCLLASGQKKNMATLHIVYPKTLMYDTLLVKDNNGKILFPQSEFNRQGTKEQLYLIPTQNPAETSFSIYFGGHPTAINDSLYFLADGNRLRMEIRDSFVLRDNIKLKLQGMYNFEELYSRYVDYYNLQMQRYPDSIENKNQHSRQEYSLKTKFDFVKKNLGNPYSIDLFSFFAIDPKDYPDYDVVKQFYQKYLKSRIKRLQVKNAIESRIEHLKQSLDEGNKAPSFSSYSIQKQLISNEVLLGKNVLLTFWATWCVPCIKEIPALKAISKDYQQDNLIIIGVSLDNDSLKMVNFIRENNLDWLHIFNDKAILDVFRINPIPAMFLINEQGMILYNTANRTEETPELKILRGLLKRKFMH
jgi:thiol-disulfide isomerase/thioredoxin